MNLNIVLRSIENPSYHNLFHAVPSTMISPFYRIFDIVKELGLALEEGMKQEADHQAALSKAKLALNLALKREKSREAIHQATLLKAKSDLGLEVS